MLLHLQKYDLVLKYVNSKYLHTADTLSRAHNDDIPCEDIDSGVVEIADHAVLQNIPVSKPRLKDLQLATANDNLLQQLKDVIVRG